MNVYERIRKMREDSGLSIKQFSKEVSLDELTLRKLEAAQKSLDEIELKKICDYFNVSPNYLLGLNNHMECINIYSDEDNGLSNNKLPHIKEILQLIKESYDITQLKGLVYKRKNKFNEHSLNKEEKAVIEEMALQERGRFFLGTDTPVGETIINILEKNYKINLLLYPLEINEIIGITNSTSGITQIFTNTNLPRIFHTYSLAQSLYNYLETSECNKESRVIINKELHYYKKSEMLPLKRQLKSDYFATEYLLPKKVLFTRFNKHKSTKVPTREMIIEIFYLQVEYYVPYKLIVKKLFELNLIDNYLHDYLIQIENNTEIINLLDNDIIEKIHYQNRISNRKYTSNNVPQTSFDLYNDGHISYSKFESIIKKYDMTPSSFASFPYNEIPITSFSGGDK